MDQHVNTTALFGNLSVYPIRLDPSRCCNSASVLLLALVYRRVTLPDPCSCRRRCSRYCNNLGYVNLTEDILAIICSN